MGRYLDIKREHHKENNQDGIMLFGDFEEKKRSGPTYRSPCFNHTK